MQARKKYGIKYPNRYAPPGHKKAKKVAAAANGVGGGGAALGGGGAGGGGSSSAAAEAAAVAKELGSFKGVLRLLKKHKDAEAFLDPVDWEALDLPDYPSVVRTPCMRMACE